MNIGILTKYKLLLVGLAILFSSCSKSELLYDSAVGGEVRLNLKVGAAPAAATNNETVINRLRVVVFGSTGSSDAGKLIINKFHPTTTSGALLKETITAGKRDIFIIANEPLDGSNQELASYKNIATVADIHSLSLAYQGTVSAGAYVPAEIPMFIEHQNRQILVDRDNEISGEVERTMAKVTMKLNVKNANFPADKFVVIDSMVIKNLPQSSFLKANVYSGALVTSERQSAAVIAPQSGYDYSSNNTFYVPEHILSDTNNIAYFEITGHVNGEPDSKSMWKVKLGDAMDDNKAYGTLYNITRNRHYTFTGDVKSYGVTEDLAVKVTVKPWNTVDLPENGGSYVSYSSVTDAAGSVIADGGQLDGSGVTLKVSCSTSVGGWYTITSNAAGRVVHIGTPTAAVSAVTTQTADVVIPPLADITDVVGYTVNIYHSTISPESVGPVKSLSFTQKWRVVEIDGLWWATGNLVANGATDAKIGAPADGGLYFQFGSLLGWKGGATGDGTGTITKTSGWFGGATFNAADEIAVTPSVFTTIANISTTWPNQTQNLYYFGDNTYATKYAKLRDFSGFSAGTLADKGVGDPCTYYLGSPWRMPTTEEFVVLCNNAANGSTPAAANAAWVTSPAKGMNFNNSSSSKLFIPASGARSSSDGALCYVGGDGNYWSESVLNAINGYYLNFTSSYVNPQTNINRRFGFSVRCVQGALIPAVISVTPTTQASIPSGGGKYTVKVTSNYGWSVSSTLSGVTFSPSSGVAGADVSVDITVPSNTGAAARDIAAVFTATGGGATVTATWTGTQLAVPPTPSIEIDGLKWATGNLVANGANDAKIGSPTDVGLYFMFGSLVGWSGGATGDGTGTAGSPALAINVQPADYTGGATWDDCGYYSDPVTSGGLPATDDAPAGIGDPCRVYLGSPWRLPTAEEWKVLCYNAPNNSSHAIANAAWVTLPAVGVNFNDNSTKLFIPASGYRNVSDGTIFYVGERGHYWSGSVANAAIGHNLHFNYSIVSPQNVNIRNMGFSVRCVQGALIPATISVTPTTQANIPAGGGKYTVKVTSNYGWSVSSTLGGVTFSPSSGAAGTNVSVDITVPSNWGAARDVAAVFTATGGGIPATATWTGAQAAAPPTPYIEINGLKWTTGNLVANGANGAKVGAPTDGGLYFQFGSLLGWKGGATGDGTGTGWPVLAINVQPSAYTGGTTWTACGYYGDHTVTSGGLPATDDAPAGIGDPCRFYLGSPWRLPTTDEFKAMCNNYGGGYNPGSANAAWVGGMNFNNNSTKLHIPASGLRRGSDGAILYVGSTGSCWSESVYSATNGYALYFENGCVFPQHNDIRRLGYPVRCVQ